MQHWTLLFLRALDARLPAQYTGTLVLVSSIAQTRVVEQLRVSELYRYH